MPDLPKLAALIARLAGIDFSQSSEQDTREIAVNTVIGELGWDTLDRNEVAREYSVRGGRVDYCLRSQARNLVLIEVKRAGTDLTEHQEQLLRYAFDEGVPLAALTDGLVWWLYLPTAKTSWEQRRFFRVNFSEQHPDIAAAALYRFLNRHGVISGEAQEEAQREFESQERERRVRAALQEAWQQVLGDPDSLLREELADAVEEISGHRPDYKVVADFLQGISGSTKTDGRQQAVPIEKELSGQHPKNDIRPRLVDQSNVHEKSDQSSRIKKQPITPVAFWIDGERYEVKTSRQVLIQVCEYLVRDNEITFAERASKIRGRLKPLFSSSPNELRDPLQISGTRLYVEGNVDGPRAERIARRTLREVRGSDDGFRVERAEPPQTL